MTDKLRQDLVDVTFVGGEQPDAYKLTGAVDQLKNAIERIDMAIGDLYSGQGETLALSQQPQVGPNLGRFVGPAGMMNPRRFSRSRQPSITVKFIGGRRFEEDPTIIEGFSHYNYRQFVLPFHPVMFSSTVGGSLPCSYTYSFSSWTTVADNDANFSIEAAGAPYGDGTAIFTTRVATLNLVNSAGDFHISPDGVITTWSLLPEDDGVKISYTFDTLGDSYDGANYNVIPDFRSTTPLCTATEVSSYVFDLVFPTISGYSFQSGSLSDSDIPYQMWIEEIVAHPSGATYSLPYFLTNGSLILGDEIPEGFIQIYDEVSDSILFGGTFTYRGVSDRVRVSGLNLTASSNRYRIIVAGTNLAQTLRTLRNSYWVHNHNGQANEFGSHNGQRISHVNLLNQIDEGGLIGATLREGYTISSLGVTTNPHPQYLHRDGYKYKGLLADGSETTGNLNNALLGDLVLSNLNDTIEDGQHSYGVHFSAPNICTLSYIYNGAMDNYLRLRYVPLQIYQSMIASDPPLANCLYNTNIVRAWANITTDGDGGHGATREGAFNIDTIVVSSVSVTCTFHTNMDGTDYACIPATWYYAAERRQQWVVHSQSNTTIVFSLWRTDTGTVIDPDTASHKLSFVVLGYQ